MLPVTFTVMSPLMGHMPGLTKTAGSSTPGDTGLGSFVSESGYGKVFLWMALGLSPPFELPSFALKGHSKTFPVKSQLKILCLGYSLKKVEVHTKGEQAPPLVAKLILGVFVPCTMKILVSSSRPQSPDHMSDASVSSRTLDGSLAPVVDFSHPPEFSSCLDNSAAKHKLLVKPRNQRSSKLRRLSSVIGLPPLCRDRVGRHDSPTLCPAS